ncbi:hypothetical protein [Corynebacterium glyciniphilum]|uniref:hypothetical protein n=1 Tax=Corynebacterium glyciniphilum TaxID=1404244 RepID=UPI0011AB5C9C|nr:hypothetical protein [Corynebacterium glyciniphilum]
MTSTNKTVTLPADVALAGAKARVHDIRSRIGRNRMGHLLPFGDDAEQWQVLRGYVRELSELLDLVESLEGADDDQ